MTTNQTIDGVPRELLERLHAEHVSIAGPGFWVAWKELRALLDVSLSDKGDMPAAPPQADPAALTIQQRITWMMCFNADLYEDWLGDNIPEDELPAWLTEEGVPESLPGSQLSKVLSYELQYANSRLAEQPAPVAVVLPELDESAIDDLAGSSCQEALAFGVHQDVFARLARTVHKRTLDEVTRLNTK